MPKSTTPIIVFYILYFVWLFTVVYLTPESNILDYFTAGVAAFYFLILREKGDFSWFLVAALFPVIFTVITFNNWSPILRLDLIPLMPVWLPLAWGTTVVALRKFYSVVVSE